MTIAATTCKVSCVSLNLDWNLTSDLQKFYLLVMLYFIRVNCQLYIQSTFIVTISYQTNLDS